MDAIHGLLAYAAVAGVAVGIGWSLLLALRGQTGGPAFERFQAAVVTVLIVGAASGLIRLAGGARPSDGLHLLYALIAIALVPLARSFVGRASGRAATGVLVVAFAVLGAVIFRLFTTA